MTNRAGVYVEAAGGGSIALNARNIELLGGSQLTAGIGQGLGSVGAVAGDITLNATGKIKEDSDITANAFQGRGGNIQINSQGIFGIEPRPRQTQKSDITASSDLGVAGAIALIAPDNSAIVNSLGESVQNPIDTNALIANSCIGRTGRLESTFTITGSGGLPHSPGKLSASHYPTGDVRQVISNTSTSWKQGDPIIEPTGVYRLADGRLVMSRECL